MKKEEVKLEHPAKRWFKLVFFLYLFILSIEAIKKASIHLAPNIKDLLMGGLPALKAVSAGWFITSLVQSSGAVGTITAAFASTGVLNLSTSVYILIGASLGTTITALIISLIIISKNRRDFRHGFEIGLSYSIYAVFLGIIVFILEYFFQLISRISLFIATSLGDKVGLLKIPNYIDFITEPIINLFFNNGSKIILLIVGFGLLILALKNISKAVVGVMGGEENTKRFINKFFTSKYKAYLIGAVLTAIVFSSSITIGLLVPLAASRLIGLKRAIPFILGADVGTFTDLFLASVIISETPALAVSISYFLIGLIGGIIFLPNTELLFKTTKYVSKKLMHISRKKALYLLAGFLLIPLSIILLF